MYTLETEEENGLEVGKGKDSRQEKKDPEPIVLVIFNIKSARYLVLFAGKSTR